MLPCVARSKQADEEEQVYSEEGTPKSDREGIKSLTHQLKDMVMKASVAYRLCKPGSAAIFDDDPPSSDGYSTPSGVTSGIGTLKNGRRDYQPALSRSNSRKDAVSSSIKSHEGDRLQSKSPRGIPKSPASRAYAPHTSAEHLSSENRSVRDDIGQEWVAQVEPGVLITFLTLSNGGNAMKRIRFSREIFDKSQAEAWWAANNEKVHELYNVCTKEKLPLTLPDQKDSEEDRGLKQFGIGASPATSPRVVGDTMTESIAGASQSTNAQNAQNVASEGVNKGASSLSADVSASENEFVTEDEPGVYITIKVLPGGMKALKRVRFSCEKFNEQQAKQWWEKNRFRIQEQYVSREPTKGTSFTSI